MKNKLFKYGITIGLIISLIGFILLKTDSLTEQYKNFYINFYRLTFSITIIYMLTKSAFVKENFDQILKVVGFIFSAILTMNLLKEFDIYDVKPIRTISYLLFSILPVMYTFHFLRNKNKKQLDYLKLVLVILLFVGGFLNLLNILPDSFSFLVAGLFWFVVVNLLYKNPKKENGMLKNVE